MLIGCAVVLFVCVALLVNTLWVDSFTRAAAPRDGGTILQTGIEPANVKVEGHGSTLLLLHGYGGAIDWWDDVSPALARHHRVIRLDLIGHGGTAAPAWGYEITRQAQMVSEVLDQLGVDRVSVVGHSMGGWVATALAAMKPERIDGLIFIDTPPTTELQLAFLVRAHVSPVVGELMSHFVTTQRLRDGLADAFAPGFPIPEKFVADLQQMPHLAARRVHEAGSRYCERPMYERLTELKPVPPLLAIYGSLDSKMSADQARLYERVPGAKLVTIDGVGHSPQVEAPKRVVELIEVFLADRAQERKLPGKGLTFVRLPD